MSEQQQQQRKGTAGRLSGQQYRELFEESHDAMVVTERDGTILDANHAASELFAWPHAEFLGMNILSVYADPEDRARYQEEIERDGFVRDFEVVFVTRNSRRLDCLLTTVVRRAPDGSVIGYQGIVRDVTERKRMEKELREYHEQVRSMAAGIVAIEDRERRRLAVDLHDGVGQVLAASRMQVEALRQAGERERQALIDDLHGLFDRMRGELRTLVFDLNPPVLHDFGLVAGLQWLAGTARTGARVAGAPGKRGGLRGSGRGSARYPVPLPSRAVAQRRPARRHGRGRGVPAPRRDATQPGGRGPGPGLRPWSGRRPAAVRFRPVQHRRVPEAGRRYLRHRIGAGAGDALRAGGPFPVA